MLQQAIMLQHDICETLHPSSSCWSNPFDSLMLHQRELPPPIVTMKMRMVIGKVKRQRKLKKTGLVELLLHIQQMNHQTLPKALHSCSWQDTMHMMVVTYMEQHFLQTTVRYTDSNIDPDNNNPDTAADDTSDGDNDDAYQLHIPDGDLHGIEAMADILNGVHLAWEMEQLPLDGNTDATNGEDNQSQSTLSSFHNINFDNDDGHGTSTVSTITENIPPLVPHAYPGDSDSKNVQFDPHPSPCSHRYIPVCSSRPPLDRLCLTHMAAGSRSK